MSTDCTDRDPEEADTLIGSHPLFARKAPSVGLELRLVVIGGPQRGVRFALPQGGSVVVGRGADADHRLTARDASRQHARISIEGNRVLVEDLASRNGIYLGGERRERFEVEVGRPFSIGTTTELLVVEVSADEERAVQAQRMEMLGRLGAGIAHDFNNVLATVTAAMEYLNGLPRGLALDDPDVMQCHEDIIAASKRGAQMATRITRSLRRPSARREQVDVGQILDEVATLSSRTFPRSIRVETHATGPLIVDGDPSALHQVLLNICVNARDAIGEAGGSLRLSALRVDGSQHDHAPPRVKVILEDDGPGMDERTQLRAFEPLFTTKGPSAGTGLGLAIVKEIVTAHQGTVTIDSAPGAGTRITLLLPLSEKVPVYAPGERGTEPPVCSVSPRTCEARILLVDDNELFARAVSRLLERDGCVVAIARSGAAALEHVTRHGLPDIVFLDLDMPGMTGELCQRQILDQHPDARIVILSGHTDPDRAQAVQDEGARAFVSKPCTLSSLRSALHTAITADRREQQ